MPYEKFSKYLDDIQCKERTEAAGTEMAEVQNKIKVLEAKRAHLIRQLNGELPSSLDPHSSLCQVSGRFLDHSLTTQSKAQFYQIAGFSIVGQRRNSVVVQYWVPQDFPMVFVEISTRSGEIISASLPPGLSYIQLKKLVEPIRVDKVPDALYKIAAIIYTFTDRKTQVEEFKAKRDPSVLNIVYLPTLCEVLIDVSIVQEEGEEIVVQLLLKYDITSFLPHACEVKTKGVTLSPEDHKDLVGQCQVFLTKRLSTAFGEAF